MDRNEIIFRLQVIALLDSFSYGLLYVFISPYLMHLGGDQVTIGIFTVLTLMFQLMSIHIVSDIVNVQGQKAALINIFNIAALSHALLFLTSSTCSIIMARCLFSSTNQSTNLIKDYIIKNLPPDRKEYHMNVYNILHSSGFVIGPAITGALFDISFTISCFIASVLTIINIWLLATVPLLDNPPSEPSDVPAVRRVRQTVERSVVELLHPHSIINWDVLVLQYLFSASVIIFSTKYSPVLKHNYNTNHTEIGLVTAYMNIVIFAGIEACHDLMERAKASRYSPTLIINAMCSILFTSSILALYSPVLGLFCLMCIPVTFSRIMIVDTWNAFITERGNPNLTKASESANILAGLTVPLIFGVVANRIGHRAVIIFSIFPVLLMLMIVNMVTVTRAPSLVQDQRHLDPNQPNECSCVTNSRVAASSAATSRNDPPQRQQRRVEDSSTRSSSPVQRRMPEENKCKSCSCKACPKVFKSTGCDAMQ